MKAFRELLEEPVRNGIYKKKEFHGRGQKVINMGELFAYDFISDQQMKRVDLNPKELTKSLVQDGDLLFARRSLVLEGSGKCSLVVQPSEDTTYESSIIRARLERSTADPRFYYYIWRSPLGRELMASIATRTAVSGITGSNLVQLKVPHPPLPTQRKIAAVLSAYDDLIENNTRRIEILEEMSRTIYREWFVHFRFPGYQKVGMVDSELGPIPEGWEGGSFSRLADLSRAGLDPSKFEDETFFHFSIPAFDDGYMPKLERGWSIKSNKFLVPDGCVLLSKINPRIPRVWLPMIERASRSITSTEFLVLVPKSPITASYLYSVCRSDEFLGDFAGLALGTSTSHQRVKPEAVFGMTVLVPPPSLIEEYSGLADPILTASHKLRLKNANLCRTRELLLPKLISGEVSVE